MFGVKRSAWMFLFLILLVPFVSYADKDWGWRKFRGAHAALRTSVIGQMRTGTLIKADQSEYLDVNGAQIMSAFDVPDMRPAEFKLRVYNNTLQVMSNPNIMFSTNGTVFNFNAAPANFPLNATVFFITESGAEYEVTNLYYDGGFALVDYSCRSAQELCNEDVPFLINYSAPYDLDHSVLVDDTMLRDRADVVFSLVAGDSLPGVRRGSDLSPVQFASLNEDFETVSSFDALQAFEDGHFDWLPEGETLRFAAEPFTILVLVLPHDDDEGPMGRIFKLEHVVSSRYMVRFRAEKLVDVGFPGPSGGGKTLLYEQYGGDGPCKDNGDNNPFGEEDCI